MGGHAPYQIPDGYPSALEVERAGRDIDFPTASLGADHDEPIRVPSRELVKLTRLEKSIKLQNR